MQIDSSVILKSLNFSQKKQLLLVESLNCRFDHGELLNSQKQAIVTLIEKKERQETNFKLETDFTNKCRHKDWIEKQLQGDFTM